MSDVSVKLYCEHHKIELIYVSSTRKKVIHTDAYCKVDGCPVRLHMEITLDNIHTIEELSV